MTTTHVCNTPSEAMKKAVAEVEQGHHVVVASDHWSLASMITAFIVTVGHVQHAIAKNLYERPTEGDAAIMGGLRLSGAEVRLRDEARIKIEAWLDKYPQCLRTFALTKRIPVAEIAQTMGVEDATHIFYVCNPIDKAEVVL